MGDIWWFVFKVHAGWSSAEVSWTGEVVDLINKKETGLKVTKRRLDSN